MFHIAASRLIGKRLAAMREMLELRSSGGRHLSSVPAPQPIADAPGGIALDETRPKQNRNCHFPGVRCTTGRISSRPKCKSPPVLADRDQQKS